MTSILLNTRKHSKVTKKIAGELDLKKLPAFLRVLLITDGTVTKSLEAYFCEPILVETLSQSNVVLETNEPSIDRKIGDSVVVRHVQLCGCDTATVYAKAESLICIDLLPKAFQRDLKQKRFGIGELLHAKGLETYRKILAVGQNTSTKEVWRRYVITMNNHAFVQVTEHFSLPVFD